jgi:Cu(I)/Ag(I) efflux system membrane protein CusA/SilA
MIATLIRRAIDNRVPVLLAAAVLAGWGMWSMLRTPLDALPDLSDVQVIIRTSHAGQAPELVENQITYPLTTTMLSVPGATTVRGFSFFGDSFVYVLFADGTDLYWARSRVLEYLAQARERLPPGVAPAIGPDATGVGWIYQYALVDRSGRHDLAELRALQDWWLKFELKTVPNVAEVATIGGMVKQYQVQLDPDRLRAYGIWHGDVVEAIERANAEVGGSVVELGEAEYMVRGAGYLQNLDDFRAIPLRVGGAGVAVRLGDVAHVQIGPEMRRGIGELDGQGEAVGGVVLLRSGTDAYGTLAALKAKLAELTPALPPGVEIVTTYDRSQLIDRAIDNLTGKLGEELVIVAIACFLFLLHLRSALVAVVTLPLGIATSFIVMHYQGVSANIMSLGGIAIAVGAMVDAAIVMVENAHKHLERHHAAYPGVPLEGASHWRVVGDAAAEVGPALFVSLLIITLSFIPVFTLEAQEGRLFAPLAFTKTYAMAAAAGLAVTLVPVLMGYLIRGRLPDEERNPLNRWLASLYRPLLERVLRAPVTTLALAAVLLGVSAWPLLRLGSEFMPPLDEGDLLYMPTALPGLSAGKAAELLQQTDRLIKTVPEVASVYGKAGRAETATDPAPLEMFETTVRLQPRSKWRPDLTLEDLIEELDATVQVPGLANVWVPPIRNRIDMLATGIKTPVGIKVAGPDLAAIDTATAAIERAVARVPGVTSALAERLGGGRYIDIDIDRTAAGRYGLNVADVHAFVAGAVGGDNVGATVEGRARFPINVRYPRERRDSVDDLAHLPIVTPSGASILLADVATVGIADGPVQLKSENARPSGWVYVDIRGRDLGSAVRAMQEAVAAEVTLPAGYSLTWAGQFEYWQRAAERLRIVVPLTLGIIALLLYVIFRRLDEALLIMTSLPLALIGGVWLLYWLDYDVSVATAVGFIALAGVAAEFGVVMLIYLRHAWDECVASGKTDLADLQGAIRRGAVLRVRPKAMTVSVILAGLLPIMWGAGTGSEVMQRIAAPMVGGMVTAPLLSMFVIPAAYFLLRRRESRRVRSR